MTNTNCFRATRFFSLRDEHVNSLYRGEDTLCDEFRSEINAVVASVCFRENGYAFRRSF